MDNIFISYRRGDSAATSGRVFDSLQQYFGKGAVFKDVDSIPIGAAFPDHLASVLARCGVVLVVMGPGWLSITDEHGQRRLDAPGDFVRLEVETALANANSKLVIPLLVDGASMPADDQLPASLRLLAALNATHVRPDPDYHNDVSRLIRIVEQYLVSRGSAAAPAALPAAYQPESIYRSVGRFLLIGGGVFLLILVLLAAGVFFILR